MVVSGADLLNWFHTGISFKVKGLGYPRPHT
jgi:hypothetical protein